MGVASMTEAQAEKVHRWFQEYTQGFADSGVALAPPLELKRLHSLRVAENATSIGQALGMSGSDLDLVSAAGLLHDVGRFPQYSRFGRFFDFDTIDHGEAGYDVLRDAVAALFTDVSDQESVLCAVRYHNRMAEDLPSHLPRSCSDLLAIVRDADKTDIVEMLLTSVEDGTFGTLPGMMNDIPQSREISPIVLATAMRRQSISFASLVTLGDLLVQLSAWFNDLNLEPSRALFRKKRILSRLRRQLPDTPEVEHFFEEVLHDPHLSSRSAAGVPDVG